MCTRVQYKSTTLAWYYFYATVVLARNEYWVTFWTQYSNMFRLFLLLEWKWIPNSHAYLIPCRLCGLLAHIYFVKVKGASGKKKKWPPFIFFFIWWDFRFEVKRYIPEKHPLPFPLMFPTVNRFEVRRAILCRWAEWCTAWLSWNIGPIGMPPDRSN